MIEMIQLIECEITVSINSELVMFYKKSFLSLISRRRFQKKPATEKLKSTLGTFDLLNLGIGAILGAGTYVVAGQVAACIAGPSATISFLISAIASLLSGLCYAEFGARVPFTSGSAYAYSYVAVGEIWAFVIGWNLILEYMIGTAADATALTASLETLYSLSVKNTSFLLPVQIPFLQRNYLDVVSCILTLIITILLAIGVKDSVYFSKVCNSINGLVFLFMIFAGIPFVNFNNWNSYDKFFPYGITGTLSGAASCFYAYVGFDIIATTGGEASDAAQSIPKAIIYSLFIVLVCYISITSIITLMVPYYQLQTRSPVSNAFSLVGLEWAEYIVSIGAVFALSSSLLGSLFPLPRIVYSMSHDGLLFKPLSIVNQSTGGPIMATIVVGVLTATISLFFELAELVEMMSIGTILAYTLVSFCVLILRYQPGYMKPACLSARHEIISFETEKTDLCQPEPPLSSLSEPLIKKTSIFPVTAEEFIRIPDEPDRESFFKALIISCVIMCLIIFSSGASIICLHISETSQFVLTIFVLLSIFMVIVLTIYLSKLPQDHEEISFKVPLVPYLPVFAIACNICLIMKLSTLTWIRFAVWMVIGFILYFGYGIKHSKADQ